MSKGQAVWQRPDVPWVRWANESCESGKRGRNRETDRSRESERRKGKRRWLSWGTMWRQKLLRMIHLCEWEEYVAAAATQRPNGDRQHHRPADRFHTSIKWTQLTRKRQHFHALFFFSTVFIQMSETLPVTKKMNNTVQWTSDLFVNYFLVSEIITPKG